jgi:arabinan endo-1,5-alpha-L-arabinosidase
MRPLAAALAAFTLSTFALCAEERIPVERLNTHDPATLLREDGRWWVFSTGVLLKHASSTDLRLWKPEGSVLKEAPAWSKEVAPGNKRSHFWAPDVIRIDDRILLYYSVSEFGKNTSAIALATSPRAHGAPWTDHGIVLRSGPGDNFNAIDPALLLDDGRLWMAYGSFWAGLFLIELDPRTGLRKDPAAEPIHLAHSPEIEAPTLHRRGNLYYLFVNEGICCRGVKSTYRIRVGRSEKVTGPYLDDQGRDLRDGGGREVLATDGSRIGPGHAGIVIDGANEWLSYHYYDAERDGAPTLGLRRLEWTGDGWPNILP